MAFIIVPQFLDILLYFESFSLCFSVWKVFTDISSNSLIFPWPSLVSWWSSKAFFVSCIVLYISSILKLFLRVSIFLFSFPVCSCMMSTFSIRVFYILIMVVLNSQFDHSKISALSESGFDVCFISSCEKHGGIFLRYSPPNLVELLEVKLMKV